MEKNTDIKKNVYAQGAEHGVVTGIYLTVVSMALFYGGTSTLLSLVALVLLLGFPGVLYVIERRYHRATGGCADISSMWLLGLVSTLCGSLICGIADYAWLQFVNPGFILEQANAAIDAYNALPEMRDTEVVETLKRAIEMGMLPTPIEFVVNMILFTTFAGSIISLIAAAIVNMLGVKDSKCGPQA
ncbi:MAG: DUF4199 domain-containing protein [Muribaculaceae bacterium]